MASGWDLPWGTHIFKALVMWAMVVAHLLLVPAAHAYLDPVYITPVTPNAGQEIEINVGVGDCDTITSEPGYPQVTREGNQIRVLLFAVRYEDIELCFLPHGTATVPFGAFEAGDYQVTVDVFYADAHGVPQTDTIGVLPMSIAGMISPPVSVPASTPVSLFVLAVGLIALARKRKEWVAVLLNDIDVLSGEYGSHRRRATTYDRRSVVAQCRATCEWECSRLLLTRGRIGHAGP